MSYLYQSYQSPLGRLIMAGDELALTGLWFEGEVDNTVLAAADLPGSDLPVFRQTRIWLDLYFGGQIPDFLPALQATGSVFQQTVWELLCQIPYGETTTYGAIARQLASQNPKGRMSAQAVGGAVGKNPIAILIPCHRVIGSDGSLTGYAAGVDKKRMLLALESSPQQADRRS